MRSISRRATLFVAAVAGVAAGPLAAQVDPGELTQRNDCRLAEQILTQGQPANKRDWALDTIGSCPGAADVLSALWSAPPSEDPALQRLYYASIQSKDPRTFAKALVVARDAGLPAQVRLAALGTAVTYVRPDLILYLEKRSRLEGVPPLQWNDVWGTLDHPVHEPDEVWLPPDARNAVLALVADLREGDAVAPLLRDAAYWLTSLHGFGN